MRSSGQPEAAAALYRRVQKHDADNVRARAGLQQLDSDARHRGQVAAAENLIKNERYLEAQDALRPVLVENPQQRDARRLQRQIEERTVTPAIVTPRLKTAGGPISLELRDVQLRAVFDTLTRSTGVSFVLDRDVRADLRTTIVLRNAQPEELIRLVLSTNQLDQKVVNETTLLVYPNTPQKQREYQELVVKSFYIANADVRQTANMVRALVKTRDLFIDEKLNLLVIKDTPNAVRLAERLIAAHDLAEPEVMLEVEVLEIGSSRLLELGIRFPDSLAVSLVGAAGVPGTISLPEWQNRSSELVQLSFTNPLFLFQLRQQDGGHQRARQPAHPRAEQGEGARAHRRPRAGHHHHRRRHRRLRLRVGELPRRGAQARGRAAHLPGRRSGDQGRARGEQHRARDPHRRQQHACLPDRHTQRRHHAAAARRRNPDPRRADQRRGSQERRPGAGTGRLALSRAPVLAARATTR